MESKRHIVLPPGDVQRTANGYRVYSPPASHILGLITSAQDAGFSLDEIRKWLPESDAAGWVRGRLAESLKARLADIAMIQARLARTRGDIEAILARIERGELTDDCFEGGLR